MDVQGSEIASFTDVLSACVAAVRCGCNAIRVVQARRGVSGIGEDSGATVGRGANSSDSVALPAGAVLKDPSDPRSWVTAADTAAQLAVTTTLRQALGLDLDIVGEEDMPNDEHPPPATKLGAAAPCGPLPPGETAEYTIPADLTTVPLRDLTIFVDPVDGTREFVEGRLSAVQCLVGVAYRGRPVLGVIGLPFHPAAQCDPAQEVDHCAAQVPLGKDGEGVPLAEATGVHVVYGMVGSPSGVCGLPPSQQPSATNAVATLAVSADLGKGTAVGAAKDAIGRAVAEAGAEFRLAPTAACGNKIMSLLVNASNVAIFNLGSSAWDTCATEAVLAAAGGRLTTLFGWPVPHTSPRYRESHRRPGGVPGPAVSHANRLGVVATSAAFASACNNRLTHEELCKKYLVPVPEVAALLQPWYGGPPEEPQAVDVARTVWGDPYTTAHLAQLVATHPAQVPPDDAMPIVRYTAPESSAVRYKQSHACRLRWTHPNGSGGSAFLKRIVLRELPQAMAKLRSAPFKLTRDVQANVNEAHLLGAAEMVRDFNRRHAAGDGVAAVEIVTPYEIQTCRFDDGPIDSRFSLLLKDFCAEEGWVQSSQLDRSQLRAALAALAAFHAFFWLGTPGAEGVSDRAFERAGPWAEYVPAGSIRDCQNVGGGGESAGAGAAAWIHGFWRCATYWDLAKQPAGQLDALLPSWRRIFAVLHEESLVKTAEAEWDRVGVELSRVAGAVEAWVHGGSPSAPPRQTLIHGDPKAANFFHRHDPLTGVGIGMIDFQWMGQGLCAVDVAYCVLASGSLDAVVANPQAAAQLRAAVQAGDGSALDASELEGESEEHLVFEVHQKLGTALKACGGGGGGLPSWEQFWREYRLAFLDLCRVMLASWWDATGNRERGNGATVVQLLKQREAMGPRGGLVFNACNKDLALGCWALRRMRVYIASVDDLLAHPAQAL